MRSWLYLVVVSGCGFSTGGTANPDGGSKDAATDGAEADASPDATFCYGAGFGRTCLGNAPSATRTFSDTTINTDGASCTQVVDNLCVVAATDIEIPLNVVVRATGSRPLVLLASGTLTITGTIGASSLTGQPAGAGSSSSPCASPTAASDDSGGAAGGAGGSFGGLGGTGGTGDLNNSGAPAGSAAGQMPGASVTPTSVRAGCTGGAGGVGVGPGGAGGRGGGAIYFIAGTAISVAVTGRVYAVGEGGRGGNNLGAGGGGGSGGLLGFDAPMVTVTGNVVANGGGGGEGAGTGGGTTGAPGTDGAATGARALGGVSGTSGGDGGDSSGGGSVDGRGGQDVNEGGGGGGGGAGYLYVKGGYVVAGGATVSPMASVTP